jgi:hypothetical protein
VAAAQGKRQRFEARLQSTPVACVPHLEHGECHRRNGFMRVANRPNGESSATAAPSCCECNRDSVPLFAEAPC